MRKINTIKLFVNHNEQSSIIAKDLEQSLKNYGFKLVDKNYDLAISIGGDGSFLRMVNETRFKKNLLYVGINAGTLGFLQEIDVNNCLDFVKRLNTNNYKLEDINIAEIKVISENKIYKFHALNEVVVRDIDLNLFKSKILIDNEVLEDFCGDGFLISTSTGSTAYNLSYNGPIIYNTLDTLVLTPMAPIISKLYKNFSNSLIIPSGKVVALNPKNSDILLTIDGANHYLRNVIKIEVKIENKRIKCLRMNDYHFIKIIKDKLLG
ncbi:MAG: NAD(+)/NADH kinase [Ruminococcus sp.]|nr:NAD(+)/NADH kinase [Ruminococcus sp.]